MVDVIVQLVLSILGGALGGVGVCLVAQLRFRQRCTSLEWAVGDLQQRASSFKGKEMAEKRWKKNEVFEAEMAEALKGAAPVRKRYDNDPLGE